MYAIRSYYAPKVEVTTGLPYGPDVPVVKPGIKANAPAKSSVPVITSYSIHYTKLYDSAPLYSITHCVLSRDGESAEQNRMEPSHRFTTIVPENFSLASVVPVFPGPASGPEARRPFRN